MKNPSLRIDSVTIPGIKGLIGICSCPGMNNEMCGFDLYGERLIEDVLTIQKWGATVLVTLLEEFEFQQLGVKDLPNTAEFLNLHWFHLPLRNKNIPDRKFEEQWLVAGPRLCQLLRDGERIVIHCREGIGRAGLIATRLLIELGIDPDKAIRTVQAARPGSLQLYAHEKYCHSLPLTRPAAVSAEQVQSGHRENGLNVI
jgi:protein-tyrosine phosphatase